eukprot:TRINITY_DN4881_c0_g1_i1.p1 TRINITY_DN4881_c0_g1~~TRINITY_DN4881_c0_g1_i1.p1  ORF type:complete len:261 (+),score=66.78 TRINITY_DN4881_c0_g1_i1:118-783(+)
MSRSTSTNWTGAFPRTALCKGGLGLVIEGQITATRVHSVFVSSAPDIVNQEDILPTRFNIVEVVPSRSYHRMKDKDEVEVDYNANQEGQRHYRAPTVFNFDQLAAFVGGGTNTALPNGFIDERRHLLHPKKNGAFEFWIDSSLPGIKEVEEGHELRISTIGNSVFVERFQNMNAKVNYFKNMDGGEDLSGAWTSALVSAGEKSDGLAQDLLEGCDDEEWSD